MGNKDFEVRIVSESERWKNLGFIDDTSRQKILDLYPQKSKVAIAPILVFSISALLVLIGIISLFAFNWDLIPDSLKLTIAILPLALSVGLYFLAERRRNQVLREVAGVVNILGAFLALGIIAQVYQLQGEVQEFYFTALAISTPFILIRPTLVSTILYQVMTGLGVFGIGGSFSPWNFELYLLIGLGLIMLSLLVYVLKYHQEERHHKSLLILPAILLPAILLRGTMEIVDFEAFSFILLLGAALALPSLDKALELLTDRRRSIFQLSGNALALAVLILGLFQWNWEDGIVMGTYSFLKEALADPWLIFIHALAVFGLVWGILRFVKTRQPEIAGLTMAALFFSSLFVPYEFMHLVASLFAMLLGIYLIISQKENQKAVTLGVLIIAVSINIRFFSSDWDLVFKGLAFILTGVLMGGGYTFYIKQQGTKKDESTP